MKEEYKWTHEDTGNVADAISLGTSKPSTPTVTHIRQVVESIYAQGKAPLMPEKVACRVVLSLKNADTENAQNGYYTIEINGTEVVDKSAGDSIAAATTNQYTENIEVDMPSDGKVTIDIYAWGSSTDVSLDSHQIMVGIGTTATSPEEIAKILDPYLKNIAMDVSKTAGTATVVLSDNQGRELLTTTNDVNVTLSDGVLIKASISSGEMAWIDRVMLTWS